MSMDDGGFDADLGAVLAVGTQESLMEGSAAWADWCHSVGMNKDNTKLLTYAGVRPGDVSQWIGVPPPPAEVVWVKLDAPEPIDGEEPHWLVFRPGEWVPSPSETYACWTSDLVVMRVEMTTRDAS